MRIAVLLLIIGVLAAATFELSPSLAQVPPHLRNEAQAVMTACRADYERLCSEVAPGGGRILACLQRHADALDAPCSRAMDRAAALKDEAAAAGVLPR